LVIFCWKISHCFQNCLFLDSFLRKFENFSNFDLKYPNFGIGKQLATRKSVISHCSPTSSFGRLTEKIVKKYRTIIGWLLLDIRGKIQIGPPSCSNQFPKISGFYSVFYYTKLYPSSSMSPDLFSWNCNYQLIISPFLQSQKNDEYFFLLQINMIFYLIDFTRKMGSATNLQS
jgi:hypothetical protein